MSAGSADGSHGRRYGSDVVVEFLARAGVSHVAFNPGATFRGLHDSLVHRPGGAPAPVLVLHEEVGVAIAHGYAKATGRTMAVFVHDLVGLSHASMAVFNAFCDNVPMLLVGGSGPRDAARRRPWIDWVHSALPQASLVRDFVKWDDEPASLEALGPSLARAWRIAHTPPCGPVYVSVDVLLQEEEVGDRVLDHPLLNEPSGPRAPSAEVERVGRWLVEAQDPVVLVDRPQRGTLPRLVDLAEQWALPVVDLGARCSFPTRHWASQAGAADELVGGADLLLGFEVRDLAWPLERLEVGTRTRSARYRDDARIVSVGLTELQHSGFLDREDLVPGAHYVTAEVPAFLDDLAEHLGDREPPDRVERAAGLRARHEADRSRWERAAADASAATPIAPEWLARCLRDALGGVEWQLANGLLEGWLHRLWDLDHDARYLGRSGGEGLGYGMPASIGAALDPPSDGLVVNVQSDGDLLYTASALWTAAHLRLPLLTVVHNNRCYGRDLVHQRELGSVRGRTDLTGALVGIAIDDPPVDFGRLAAAQGVEGIGPVTKPDALPAVLDDAVSRVVGGRRPVLVDVVCRTP